MTTKIQLRRGNLIDWTTYNPVILSGEMVLISTNNDGVFDSYVTGDGAHEFSALPIYSFEQNLLNFKAENIERGLGASFADKAERDSVTESGRASVRLAELRDTHRLYLYSINDYSDAAWQHEDNWIDTGSTVVGLSADVSSRIYKYKEPNENAIYEIDAEQDQFVLINLNAESLLTIKNANFSTWGQIYVSQSLGYSLEFVDPIGNFKPPVEAGTSVMLRWEYINGKLLWHTDEIVKAKQYADPLPPANLSIAYTDSSLTVLKFEDQDGSPDVVTGSPTGIAASYYNLRYKIGSPIFSESDSDEEKWSKFNSCARIYTTEKPKKHGNTNYISIQGLKQDTQYYFAIAPVTIHFGSLYSSAASLSSVISTKTAVSTSEDSIGRLPLFPENVINISGPIYQESVIDEPKFYAKKYELENIVDYGHLFTYDDITNRNAFDPETGFPILRGLREDLGGGNYSYRPIGKWMENREEYEGWSPQKLNEDDPEPYTNRVGPDFTNHSPYTNQPSYFRMSDSSKSQTPYRWGIDTPVPYKIKHMFILSHCGGGGEAALTVDYWDVNLSKWERVSSVEYALDDAGNPSDMVGSGRWCKVDFIKNGEPVLIDKIRISFRDRYQYTVTPIASGYDQAPTTYEHHPLNTACVLLYGYIPAVNESMTEFYMKKRARIQGTRRTPSFDEFVGVNALHTYTNNKLVPLIAGTIRRYGGVSWLSAGRSSKYAAEGHNMPCHFPSGDHDIPVFLQNEDPNFYEFREGGVLQDIKLNACLMGAAEMGQSEYINLAAGYPESNERSSYKHSDNRWRVVDDTLTPQIYGYPVPTGDNVDQYESLFSNPFNYISKAAIAWEMAARYGTKNDHPDSHFYRAHVAANAWNAVRGDSDAKVVDEVPTQGLGYVDMIEMGNEEDKTWKSARIGYHFPREVAAQSSAMYDGHGNTMSANVPNVGTVKNFGIKNGDPNIEVALCGFSGVGYPYIKDMMNWFEENRSQFEEVYPFDAICNHHYPTYLGSQGSSWSEPHSYVVPPEDNVHFNFRKWKNNDTVLGQEVYKEAEGEYLKILDMRDREFPNKAFYITEWAYGEHGANKQVYSAPRLMISSNEWIPQGLTRAAWMIRGLILQMEAGVDRIDVYWLEGENLEFANNLGSYYKERHDMANTSYSSLSDNLYTQFVTMSYWPNQYYNSLYPIQDTFWYVATFRHLLKGLKLVRVDRHDENENVYIAKFARDAYDDNPIRSAFVVWKKGEWAYDNAVYEKLDNVTIALPDNVTGGLAAKEVHMPLYGNTIYDPIYGMALQKSRYGHLDVDPYLIPLFDYWTEDTTGYDPDVDGICPFPHYAASKYGDGWSGTGNKTIPIYNTLGERGRLDENNNFIVDPNTTNVIDVSAAQVLAYNKYMHTPQFKLGAEGVDVAGAVLNTNAVMLPKVDELPRIILFEGARVYPAPGKISKIHIIAIDESSARLMWENTSRFDDSYEIQYKVAGGSFSQWGIVDVNEFTGDYCEKIITGLMSGTEYTFYILSRVNGVSAPLEDKSDEVSITTTGALSAPYSIAVEEAIINNNYEAAKVDWMHNNAEVSRFIVQAALTDSFSSIVSSITVPLNVDTNNLNYSAELTGLNSNTTYYFRVKAESSTADKYTDSVAYQTELAPAVPPQVLGASANSAGNTITVELDLPLIPNTGYAVGSWTVLQGGNLPISLVGNGDLPNEIAIELGTPITAEGGVVTIAFDGPDTNFKVDPTQAPLELFDPIEVTVSLGVADQVIAINFGKASGTLPMWNYVMGSESNGLIYNQTFDLYAMNADKTGVLVTPSSISLETYDTYEKAWAFTSNINGSNDYPNLTEMQSLADFVGLAGDADEETLKPNFIELCSEAYESQGYNDKESVFTIKGLKSNKKYRITTSSVKYWGTFKEFLLRYEGATTQDITGYSTDKDAGSVNPPSVPYRELAMVEDLRPDANGQITVTMSQLDKDSGNTQLPINFMIIEEY